MPPYRMAVKQKVKEKGGGGNERRSYAPSPAPFDSSQLPTFWESKMADELMNQFKKHLLVIKHLHCRLEPFKTVY